jgi:hypothetical protein
MRSHAPFAGCDAAYAQPYPPPRAAKPADVTVVAHIGIDGRQLASRSENRWTP